MSKRAHTHYQAIRLVEKYRMFAGGSRFLVGGTSWQMNPRKDPSSGNRPRAEFRNIALAEDGTTEIELEDRYRLVEPFDIEFNEHGFVVWSASSIRVAKHVKPERSSHPTVLAPILGELESENISIGTATAVRHHMPFEDLSSWAVRALEEGAPVTGLLDYDQFPVLDHGWSASPDPAVGMAVRLIYW